MSKLLIFLLFFGIVGCGSDLQLQNPFTRTSPQDNTPNPGLSPKPAEDFNEKYNKKIESQTKEVLALFTSTYKKGTEDTLLTLPGSVPERVSDYFSYSYFPLETAANFSAYSKLLPADRTSFTTLVNWIGKKEARTSLRSKLYLSGGSAFLYNLKGSVFGGGGSLGGVKFVNGNYAKGYQNKVFAWLDEISVYSDVADYKKNPVVLSLAIRVPWLRLREKAQWPEDTVPSERKKTAGLADGLPESIDEWVYLTYRFTPDEFRELLQPTYGYKKHRLETEYAEILATKEKQDDTSRDDSFKKYDTITTQIKVNNKDYINPNRWQSTFSGNRIEVKAFDYGLLFIGTYEMTINSSNEFLGFRIPVTMVMGQLSAAGTPNNVGIYKGKFEAKLRNFGAPTKSIDSSVFRNPSSIGINQYVGNIELTIDSQGVNSLSIAMQTDERRRKDKDGKYLDIVISRSANILSFVNKGTSKFDTSQQGSPFFLELQSSNSYFIGVDYLGRLVPIQKIFDSEKGYIQGAFYGPNREYIAGVISYRAGYTDEKGVENGNATLYGAYAIKKYTP